jgi:hypothetical protein
MTLSVKDANTQVQNLSTQADAAGNLVPVHMATALVGGVAVPVSAANPLPVVNAAGGVANDGSAAVVTGGAAQTLFGGVTPNNGWLVANNSNETLWASDVGAAIAGGAAIPIAPGQVFTTPSGYRPPGPVSLYGGTTGQAFAARRW